MEYRLRALNSSAASNSGLASGTTHEEVEEVRTVSACERGTAKEVLNEVLEKLEAGTAPKEVEEEPEIIEDKLIGVRIRAVSFGIERWSPRSNVRSNISNTPGTQHMVFGKS